MQLDVLENLDKIISIEKLDKIDFDWGDDIAFLSRSLDKVEILAYYGLKAEELVAEDNKIVDILITRGQTKAITEASDALFRSMSTPSGGSASSLEYLRRFANGWKIEKDSVTGQEKFLFVMNNGDTPNLKLKQEKQK